MAGADIAFNVAKGRHAHYGSLPGTNDALILVFLEADALVGDATMEDYDTLAAVLAGASNEQSTLGRQTLTGASVTVNDTDDQVEVDAADVVIDPASGDPTGAALVCYDPDTTGGDDTTIIPLTKHSYDITPDGSELTVTVSNFVVCT
jgi:hypothetical protein